MQVWAQWWPVNYDVGLIRADPDTAAAAWVALYAASGVQVPATPLSGPLGDVLSRLEPLTYPPRKDLFLATSFGWTVYLQNSPRGSDPFLPMSKLSRALGVTALRACVTPPNAVYQGVILEVYDTPQAGGDANGYRRSIAAANDGGRWVFHQSGTPFAFEDTAPYAARRKRDRFTPDMLFRYLEHLGIPRLTDAALQPGGSAKGMLMARPPLQGFATWSLAEARSRDFRNRG